MEIDLLKKTPRLRLVNDSETSSIVSGPRRYQSGYNHLISVPFHHRNPPGKIQRASCFTRHPDGASDVPPANDATLSTLEKHRRLATASSPARSRDIDRCV
jgi:hypothetical protein